MTRDEIIRGLEKEVQRRKRIAAEWAGRMHDLAEERLPERLDEIPSIAEGTLAACRSWKDAVDELSAARAAEEVTAP
ncbi:CCE_0567 family metalloprotein [Aquisphaera insulae]|uniref:CCE_0567 family metalloprotein n=1 Tax=Aquisphaera insulae TaxID=2712864 RepID=UPI0013EBF469|nr:CCE_0567 family metalloprotein [Aquisphaera insulae]